MLPKGLHRIRHYGLFANGDRAAYIARARELLGVPSRSKPANTSEATASAEPRMKATRVRHGTGKPSTVEAAFEANHVIPVNGSRVGNFYTLSKRRCGPPLTSPLDRAAVAPSELSASELGHPRDEHLSRRSLPVFQAQLVDAPPARARRRCYRQDLGDFARDDEAATARG